MLKKCNRIFKKVNSFTCYIHVQLFRKLFYEDVFFNTKHFRSIGSYGWKIASADIRNRFRCQKNWNIKWPVSPDITCTENIVFDPNDINNFWGSGNYYQAYNGHITIGKGTYIANNVGIITENHSIYNLDIHDEPKDIQIGNNCWIGMNSIVLPGVILGDRTIVGAGSIVTKSFKDGNCVIAGNPAKIIRKL